MRDGMAAEARNYEPLDLLVSTRRSECGENGWGARIRT